MPYRQLCALILVLLCALGADAEPEGSKLKALLIGVESYQHKSWPTLTTNQDLEAMSGLLVSLGVPPDQVLTVSDEAATRQGILKAVDQLEASVNEGDTVLLYYAGHGFLVRDDNSEETDGLDECLVPHDSKGPSERGYAESVIRDDLVESWIARLKARAKPHKGSQGSVVLVFDSCHSGSLSREYEVAALRTRAGDPAELARLQIREASLDQPSDVGGIFASRHLAGQDGWVILTACSAEETAKESPDGGGIFTQSLVRVLQNDDQEGLTYLDLTARLGALIRSRLPAAQQQTPQVEGDRDLLLLRGLNRPASPDYVAIRALISPTEVRLQKGAFRGLHPGTRLKFTTGTSGDKGLFEATVVDDENAPLYARAKLDRPITKTMALEARGWVTQRAFGSRKVKIYFDPRQPWNGRSAAIREYLTSDYYASRLVEVVEEPSQATFVAFSSAGAAPIQLISRQGDSQIAVSQTRAEAIEDSLYRQLLEKAQADYLMRIPTTDEGLALKVRVGRFGKTGTQKEMLASFQEVSLPLGPSGMPQARNGDGAVLTVSNNTKKPMFVSILNIGPSGKTQVLYPTARLFASTDRLAAGKSVSILAGLEGLKDTKAWERFRVIGTRERYPLHLMNPQTSATRGETRPIESSDLGNPVEELLRGLPVKRGEIDLRRPPKAFQFSPLVEIEIVP